jgi:hypothetical protein
MIFIIPLRECGWTCWVRMYSLFLSFYRGGSELRSWRRRVGRRPASNLAGGSGPPQEAYHGQDSDVILDFVGTLVWLLVLMLSLVIVALQCPLPRRFVRSWTIWCNKYVISLLGLIFVSYLVTYVEGTLQRWTKHHKSSVFKISILRSYTPLIKYCKCFNQPWSFFVIFFWGRGDPR